MDNMVKKIIGIIPARLGSKRLREKNLLPINGKPMLHWTIDAALNSKYFSRENLFVSSESQKILECVGDKCTKIVRPDFLAEDHVWLQDVVNHLLENVVLGDDDLVVILQANSPEIMTSIIDECIEKVISDELWQMSTVGTDFINNGHLCVLRKNVCNHRGKANYNGFVVVDWVDVHTEDDYREVKERLKARTPDRTNNE